MPEEKETQRHFRSQKISLKLFFLIPVIAMLMSQLSADTLMAEDREQETLSPVRSISTKPLLLNEFDLLSIVIADTESVRQQKLDTLIAEQGIINSKSIFEPSFRGSYDRSYNIEQNDTEQAVTRNEEADYKKRENIYSTAVTGLLPTGTEYRIFYDLNDPKNSLQEEEEYGKEFRVRTGIELTQPILKDFGLQANMANIAKSEKEYAIAQEKYRRAQMTSAYLAAISYADLQLSQERLRSEEDLLAFENESANLIERLIGEGKASHGQLFHAETNLARREARVSYAKKVLRRTSAVVRQLLIGTSAETFGRVEAVDKVEVVPNSSANEINEERLRELFPNRPEYIEAKLNSDLSKIRYEYASNQNLPDLDLRVSYGKTGLAEDWSGANNLLDENYEFWSVGAYLVVPMLGDIKGDSTLAAAKLRQQKDILALTNIETLIQDEILTATAEQKQAAREVAQLQNVIAKLESLLEEDRKKQLHGKLSRYEIIAREMELKQAHMGLFEKQIEYRKVLLTLWLAEGRLLQQLGLEEMVASEDTESE